MPQRRMFSKDITYSDAFRNMPLSAQALYFHLGMDADDDGVVSNPRNLQRSIMASEDDLRILIVKRFVIPIEEAGIIVIKHWKINNYIQKDRYTPSKYRKELKMLGLDENKSYTELQPSLFDETPCTQNVYTGKDSIGKDSIEENNLIDMNDIECIDRGVEEDDDIPF